MFVLHSAGQYFGIHICGISQDVYLVLFSGLWGLMENTDKEYRH